MYCIRKALILAAVVLLLGAHTASPAPRDDILAITAGLRTRVVWLGNADHNTGNLMGLDTDEGARYLGEFALGLNPLIKKPMKDTLFDEKIGGSLHLTPGRAYEDADNGNRSSVHWDLVLIQTPEWGGGEIYFDDVLVRKDGLFVLPELEGLNPDNLL